MFALTMMGMMMYPRMHNTSVAKMSLSLTRRHHIMRLTLSLLRWNCCAFNLTLI